MTLYAVALHDHLDRTEGIVPEFFEGGVQSHPFRLHLNLLYGFELLQDDAFEGLFACAHERFSIACMRGQETISAKRGNALSTSAPYGVVTSGSAP